MGVSRGRGQGAEVNMCGAGVGVTAGGSGGPYNTYIRHGTYQYVAKHPGQTTASPHTTPDTTPEEEQEPLFLSLELTPFPAGVSMAAPPETTNRSRPDGSGLQVVPPDAQPGRCLQRSREDRELAGPEPAPSLGHVPRPGAAVEVTAGAAGQSWCCGC